MCDGLGITYSQSKMEQIMVLSCNKTRKHQFWSTGGGERLNNYSVPPQACRDLQAFTVIK